MLHCCQKFFFSSQHYTCYGLTVSLCVNTHPFIYKFPFMLQIKGMSDVELWWEHYSGSCSQPSNNRPVLKCSLIAEWRSHPFWSQGDSKNGLNWTKEDTFLCQCVHWIKALYHTRCPSWSKSFRKVAQEAQVNQYLELVNQYLELKKMSQKYDEKGNILLICCIQHYIKM